MVDMVLSSSPVLVQKFLSQKVPAMKFKGDQDGIRELKIMKEKRMQYLKYLLTEAQTNFDHTSEFKAEDNSTRYRITYDPQTGELDVQKI